MSYPQQPGQYPQQPGYPQPGQYPAGQAPIPPFPGGNDVEREPSKGTAIAAAILAVLGTIWAVIFAIVNFSRASDLGPFVDDLKWLVWSQAIAYVIEVFTLGPGAALLLRRKNLGRWLVTAGSSVHIIQGIIALIALTNAVAPSGSEAAFLTVGAVGVAIVLAPAIATIILALLRPTGRWLNWTPPQPQPW